jgi:hypothetical protein
MCNPGPATRALDGPAAARTFATMMERNLGLSSGMIDPVALRLFFLAHWSKLTVLAHEIHDAN